MACLTHIWCGSQSVLMAVALEKYGESEGVVPRGAFREGDPTEVETYAEFLDMNT